MNGGRNGQFVTPIPRLMPTSPRLALQVRRLNPRSLGPIAGRRMGPDHYSSDCQVCGPSSRTCFFPPVCSNTSLSEKNPYPQKQWFIMHAKLVVVTVISQEMGINAAGIQSMPIPRNGDSDHRDRGVLGAGESPLRRVARSGTRRTMLCICPGRVVRAASNRA